MNRDEFFQSAAIHLFVGLHCVDRRPMKVEDEIEEAMRLANLLTDAVLPEKKKARA